MAESHVVSGLVAKKSELAGLIQHYQAEISRISFDLKHLDATIKLFDPDFDLRTVKSKEYRERNQYFKPGECLRLALDVLREAGQPMNSQDIGLSVIGAKGFENMPDACKQAQKSVFAALANLEAKGLVSRIEKDGLLVYWQLV